MTTATVIEVAAGGWPAAVSSVADPEIKKKFKDAETIWLPIHNASSKAAQER
jgi:hypothetical protein